MYKLMSAALAALSLSVNAFALPVSDAVINTVIQRMSSIPGTYTIKSIGAVVAVAERLMADQPLDTAFIASAAHGSPPVPEQTLRQAMTIMIRELPDLSRANRYRLSIGETAIQDREEEEAALRSRITTQFNDREGLLGRIALFAQGATSLGLYEFGGYSGAGYADVASLRESLRARVLELVAEDTRIGGENAKTVIICGGTVDGVGVIYDVIKNLRTSGAVDSSKIMVAGIVSDQAVDYHLEGLEKGWGDVLSPHHDALLLVDSFSDDGKQSWEVKESSDARSFNSAILDGVWVSQMVQLFGSAKAWIPVRTSVEVFEGGPIALDEPFEAVIHNYVNSGSTALQLNLHRGFETKKRAKDQGVRAATDLSALAAMLGGHPLARQFHIRDVATAPLVVDVTSADEQALAQRRATSVAGLRARALSIVEGKIRALERSQTGNQRYFDNMGVSPDIETRAHQYYAGAISRAVTCEVLLGGTSEHSGGL